jgi:hypothetical protein
MNFIFPYIGNVIIPTDELIFFRGVGSTTNQYINQYHFWISVGELINIPPAVGETLLLRHRQPGRLLVPSTSLGCPRCHDAVMADFPW